MSNLPASAFVPSNYPVRRRIYTSYHEWADKLLIRGVPLPLVKSILDYAENAIRTLPKPEAQLDEASPLFRVFTSTNETLKSRAKLFYAYDRMGLKQPSQCCFPFKFRGPTRSLNGSSYSFSGVEVGDMARAMQSRLSEGSVEYQIAMSAESEEDFSRDFTAESLLDSFLYGGVGEGAVQEQFRKVMANLGWEPKATVEPKIVFPWPAFVEKPTPEAEALQAKFVRQVRGFSQLPEAWQIDIADASFYTKIQSDYDTSFEVAAYNLPGLLDRALIWDRYWDSKIWRNLHRLVELATENGDSPLGLFEAYQNLEEFYNELRDGQDDREALRQRLEKRTGWALVDLSTSFLALDRSRTEGGERLGEYD